MRFAHAILLSGLILFSWEAYSRWQAVTTRLRSPKFPNTVHVPIDLGGAELMAQTLPSVIHGALLTFIGFLLCARKKEYIKVRNDTGANIYIKVSNKQDVITKDIKETIKAQGTIKATEMHAAFEKAVERVLLKLKVQTWTVLGPATRGAGSILGAKKQSALFNATGTMCVTAVDPDNLKHAFVISQEVPPGDELVITSGTVDIDAVLKLMFDEKELEALQGQPATNQPTPNQPTNDNAKGE